MSHRAPGDSTIYRMVTDVVGSGPRSVEDMTPSQAREAFREVLRGDPDPDPTTLGAFLLANRWKGNTPEELAAFLDVMHEESVERVAPDAPVVDCGANYDGKVRTALLGVGAGITAAATGVPVVVHSGDRVPTKRGTTYKHVLDALGVPTEIGPADSAAMVDRAGFGFYYQPAFNPRVHDLLDRRERMGVRTFINTIETLANPAAADVHLGSFYHLTFARKLIDTVRESDALNLERVLLFQGLEGYDDVRPGYTKLATWDGDGDGIAEEAIETASFGLTVDEDDFAVEDVAGESAAITESVLAGDRTDAFAEAIALNAALRIYAAGEVDDLPTGVALAREAIEDGSAAETLATLRQFRPQETIPTV